MEPMLPDESDQRLAELATELIAKASRLSGALHPITQKAIAELVRPMNSYYSNRIEGHQTHPHDIDRALRSDFSQDREKRDLQQEAVAHIRVSKALREGALMDAGADPSSIAFLKGLHKAFYDQLPERFRMVESREGGPRAVVPGEFRDAEVQVARHIGPASSSVPRFMQRFEEAYRRSAIPSRVRRVVAIAAAHHRLAWIHPFLDGNGRVMRLYSDACFMTEELDAGGIWSIARGLARNRERYYDLLAQADAPRRGDLDGRGNLSLRGLEDFCAFFLKTAIDQVEFMHQALMPASMDRRIDLFVDRMVADGRMRTEARYILKELFARGELARADAERITGRSDKTLALITDNLLAQDLLSRRKAGVAVVFEPKYPIMISPWILPGLYPDGIEVEMKTAG